MKAIKDNIILELLPTTRTTILGELKIKNISKGKVVSIGPLANMKAESNLKENDIVYFNKHSGQNINYENKPYHILSVSQIFYKEN